MKGESEHSVTRLLQDWRSGDLAARDRLLPVVYREMQRIARRELRRERSGHTLESRDLVHEAYERLADVDVPWNDRAHFFAIAARTMRRVLVDHARSKKAEKRGAGVTLISLDQDDSHLMPASQGTNAVDVLIVDAALTRLGEIDKRMEQVVELHFFGGMTHDEMAAATGVSVATTQRDLRFAKAWLYRHLSEGT